MSMAHSALFVEIPGVLIADSNATTLLPGVAAAIVRLQQRGVPVIAVSDQLALNPSTASDFAQRLHALVLAAGAKLTDIVIATSESPKSWTKPRPGLLLAAARSHSIDLPTSWLIGIDADDARAAGQAGCAGAVLLGSAALPTDDLGIVVAQARDLADAPRVMIPRGGGCWHQMTDK
jgi:histidinol phosphatase-like enzyme